LVDLFERKLNVRHMNYPSARIHIWQQLIQQQFTSNVSFPARFVRVVGLFPSLSPNEHTALQWQIAARK